MEGLPGHPVRRRRPGPGGRPAVLSARRIVLLRHGRTGHNVGGVIQGQLDIPLDDTGRQQAQVAAAQLAAFSPYAVLSSDLSRALETAEAVAAAARVPVTVDARLRELDLGAWQGLTAEQAGERYPQEQAAWRAGLDVRRGGGETYAEAGARAADSLLSAALPAGRTLVAVTHGGTARAALGTVLQLPAASLWRLTGLDNCCWSTLVEGHRGWRLEGHGIGGCPPTGTTPATL